MEMEPLQAIATVLGLATFIAWLAESTIEYLVGLPFDKFPQLEKHRWVLPYVAAIVGVILAWVYKFDLVALFGQFMGQETAITYPGIILSGLALGRGTEFVHNIAKRYFLQE